MADAKDARESIRDKMRSATPSEFIGYPLVKEQDWNGVEIAEVTFKLIKNKEKVDDLNYPDYYHFALTSKEGVLATITEVEGIEVVKLLCFFGPAETILKKEGDRSIVMKEISSCGCDITPILNDCKKIYNSYL